MPPSGRRSSAFRATEPPIPHRGFLPGGDTVIAPVPAQSRRHLRSFFRRAARRRVAAPHGNRRNLWRGFSARRSTLSRPSSPERRSIQSPPCRKAAESLRNGFGLPVLRQPRSVENVHARQTIASEIVVVGLLVRPHGTFRGPRLPPLPLRDRMSRRRGASSFQRLSAQSVCDGIGGFSPTAKKILK